MTKPNPQEPGSAEPGPYETMVNDAMWFKGRPDDDDEDRVVAWSAASSIACEADAEIAALARKLEEAKRALEFYANKKNYSETVRTSKTFSLLISPVGDDEGGIARRALAQMEQG